MIATATQRGPADTWTVARALAELPPDGPWEIDAGRLEMHEPPGPYHGNAMIAVGVCLANFVRSRGLGRVLAGDPGFHLAQNPDILRAPDVAFLSNARVQAITDPDAFATVPPDLAVEIPSPGDRPAAMRRKVAQYLEHGVRSVWILDPRVRRLEQHFPGGASRLVSGEDAVVEDPTLPGFRCRLSDLLPDPWPKRG